MIAALTCLGVVGFSALWLFYELGSMRAWTKHNHVRPRWRRAAAAMGTFQLGISATLVEMNLQNDGSWGAALSGSMATGMLGLCYWAYVVLQPKWAKMHDSLTPGEA